MKKQKSKQIIKQNSHTFKYLSIGNISHPVSMTFPPVSTTLLPPLLPLLPSPPKWLPLLSVDVDGPVATPPTPPLPPVPPLPPSSLSFFGCVSTGPSCSFSSSSSPSSSSSFLKLSNYCLMTFLNILGTNNYDNSICCYTENLNILFFLLLFWNTFNLRPFPFAQH